MPWTVERVALVHEALPERYRVAATIAPGLALRQGEVFGLAVEDIDFLRGSVKVRRQVRLFSTGGQAYRLPKGRRDREIPLPDSVRDEIAVHLAAYPAQSVELPWDTTDGKPVTVALVLTTPEGEALKRKNFNGSVWGPALKKAGVEQTKNDGMHACRHFFAPVLLTRGRASRRCPTTSATRTPASPCGHTRT